ncbi:MAG: flagellar biosynthetic protein FliR [Oscillospiraceae bacterium]
MSDNLFWDTLLNNFSGNILVFARVMGIFSFNPMFSRKNMPTSVKIGASLSLAIIIIIAHGQENIEFNSLGSFAVAVLLETFVGFVLGFLTQMFLSTMLVAGDIMDTQSGLGMGKIYDPSSGVQMPLFGSVTTYLFVLYFFVTNAHLSYIKIFDLSFEIIPVGVGNINTDVGMVIVEYFATILTLSLKLALPMIAAQLILEFCMGILMKTVPQIQVMAVNIQLKLLFGLFLLYVLAVPMSNFLDDYMDTMMQSLEGILPLLAK